MEIPLPTRLLLTALPPSLTLPLLRAHISLCPPQPPQLTDLKILLKPDGTSRRIAFIGFRTHAEGERVLNWIEGSWIAGVRGGARISAQWAKEVRLGFPQARRGTETFFQAKDAPAPRKRSHAAISNDITPTTASTTRATTANDDAARFAEFMSVMAPKKKRTLESLNQTAEPVLITTKPDVRSTEDDQVIGVAQEVVVVDDVAENEEISDMEYMARRMKRNLNEEEEVEETEIAMTETTLAFKPWTSEELDQGEASSSFSKFWESINPFP